MCLFLWLEITVTYLSETMIFGLYAECGAHVFLRAHRLYAFEILEALKIQPSLLDPDNSVRIETNKDLMCIVSISYLLFTV
jgi:hypothetical protein